MPPFGFFSLDTQYQYCCLLEAKFFSFGRRDVLASIFDLQSRFPFVLIISLKKERERVGREVRRDLIRSAWHDLSTTNLQMSNTEDLCLIGKHDKLLNRNKGFSNSYRFADHLITIYYHCILNTLEYCLPPLSLSSPSFFPLNSCPYGRR